jgi:streptogramin lyase
MGDFNNDSRLDIAVANNLANNIGVFLSYGSQPFAGVTTYSTGDESQPHSVAVGDLNHDGWSDIVVANYGTDNVGVLLGYGDGTFDLNNTYPTGSGSAPYSVAVADFNNDTHLDIVVTNSETDNIAIRLGYGNGTFASRMTYTTGALSQPYTVVIADFNNDNRLDLAIANSGTSNVFLLYGYGNGTFGNQTSYPLGYGYHPYSIAVADLNQDHWMDIVIACYDTDHVETLIQMC